MNRQDVNPLQEYIKELLHELGEVPKELSDTDLDGWLQLANMNKQDVKNQLHEYIKGLLYKLGYEVPKELSGTDLDGWSQLVDRLVLVFKLVLLNLTNWEGACAYVRNLSYGDVQAALQLSDDGLAQKFKIDQCNNDSVGNLSHNEVQEEPQLSDDNPAQNLEEGRHNNGNSNSKRKMGGYKP